MVVRNEQTSIAPEQKTMDEKTKASLPDTYMQMPNDSLQPLVPKNSTLFINTQDVPVPGKIIAVEHAGSGCMIFGALTGIGGENYLVSPNVNYPPILVGSNRVIGIVQQFAVDF
jgi:SOS-response transcriptional repressor LexA